MVDNYRPSPAELSIQQLKEERERLRALLDPVETHLLERLGFARAVPIRTFSAQAVSLIEGFAEDPRPLVIYVSGTDRSCILRPAHSDNSQDEVVRISKLGQHASPLLKRVWESRRTSPLRVGIWRGGKRTGCMVAELCPGNDDSDLYIDVLGGLT